MKLTIKLAMALVLAVASLLSASPCWGQPALTAKMTVSLSQPGAEPRILSSGLLFYDSQKRTREEVTRYDSDGRPIETIITITDPLAQRSYRVDPEQRTAEQRYFRPPSVADPQPGEPGSPFPEGSFVVKPAAELGEQLIDGRLCHGTVYGESPLFKWQIAWWDNETGLAILRIEARKRGKILKTTISDIRLEEPDASLFYPPSDYTVREVSP